MNDFLKNLSNERKLVLYCSKGHISDCEIKEIKEIFSKWINWSEVLYQAVTHRTLCLLYYHIEKLGLAEKVEREILRCMKNEYTLNLNKNEILLNELQKVCHSLESNQIKYSVLKGGVLSSLVYPNIGTRIFNDLDILINYADGKKAVEVLESSGYIQGQYEFKNNTVTKFNRKQKLYHQINTHEFASLNKATGNPFYTNIEVDFNHSIFGKNNFQYEVDVNELLNRAMKVDIKGSHISTLYIDDFLIQLCAHLYREAIMIITIRRLKDLQLVKFADVSMFIERYADKINWKQFVARCKNIGCLKVIYFVFYYVNILYADSIPLDVLEALEPKDKEYMNMFGFGRSTRQKWHMDFTERLFNPKRVLELNKNQIAANEKYLSYQDKLS